MAITHHYREHHRKTEPPSVQLNYSVQNSPSTKSSEVIEDMTGPWLFSAWQPPVNIEESDAAIVFTMDAPGVTSGQLKVLIDNDILTISGHRSTQQSQNEMLHRNERQGGMFKRSFGIPKQIDSSHIQASYRHGVLRVIIPKSAKPIRRPTKIQLI
ncbi:MAG: Hsp20/alpha crystallin family protein [Xanthomonadales bacterium]|nr:Hsp20/alpha crystallin family protein [Xanthomonadales bacterium]